jgi:hypothetical protein
MQWSFYNDHNFKPCYNLVNFKVETWKGVALFVMYDSDIQHEADVSYKFFLIYFIYFFNMHTEAF